MINQCMCCSQSAAQRLLSLKLLFIFMITDQRKITSGDHFAPSLIINAGCLKVSIRQSTTIMYSIMSTPLCTLLAPSDLAPSRRRSSRSHKSPAADTMGTRYPKQPQPVELFLPIVFIPSVTCFLELCTPMM